MRDGMVQPELEKIDGTWHIFIALYD